MIQYTSMTTRRSFLSMFVGLVTVPLSPLREKDHAHIQNPELDQLKRLLLYDDCSIGYIREKLGWTSTDIERVCKGSPFLSSGTFSSYNFPCVDMDPTYRKHLLESNWPTKEVADEVRRRLAERSAMATILYRAMKAQSDLAKQYKSAGFLPSTSNSASIQ